MPSNVENQRRRRKEDRNNEKGVFANSYIVWYISLATYSSTGFYLRTSLIVLAPSYEILNIAGDINLPVHLAVSVQ